MEATHLAAKVAEAAERLVHALDVENTLKRSPNATLTDVISAQEEVERFTAEYLKAMRSYVQFFEGVSQDVA